MTDAAQDLQTAEVLTADIPNRTVLNGRPFMLLKSEAGAYALAHQIGDRVELRSKWVEPQNALDGALAVLTGDKRALTHPDALLSVSIAHVAIWVEAQRKKAGGAT